MSSMNLCLGILAVSGTILYLTLFFAFNRPNLKTVYIIVLLSIMLASEWASAQQGSVRHLFMFLEAAALLGSMFWTIIQFPQFNNRSLSSVVILAFALVLSNFVACISTYGKLSIYLWSTYDTCKYFIVLLFVAMIELSKKDVETIVYWLSNLVFISLCIAVLQYIGYEQLFNPFRGRFNVIRRSGVYRSIGFFPHPIELGNWSAVSFALIYTANMHLYNKKTFSLASLASFILALLSGTRTAVIAIAISFIILNLDKILKLWKQFIVIMLAAAIVPVFFPVEEVIARLISDVNTELPRQYFFEQGLRVFMRHPIFGIGFGTYGSIRYRELSGDLIFNDFNLHRFDYAGLASSDSFYAGVIPEFGIIGLLLASCFAVLTIKVAKQSGMRFWLVIPLTCLILSFNSSTALFSPHVGFYFWFALGLVFSTSGSTDLDNYNLSNMKARIANGSE